MPAGVIGNGEAFDAECSAEVRQEDIEFILQGREQGGIGAIEISLLCQAPFEIACEGHKAIPGLGMLLE